MEEMAKMNVCYAECGSTCGSEAGRYFLTREEKISKLQKYKEALDLESKAVSERIANLEKEE